MKKVAVSIHAIDNFNFEVIEGLEGFDYIHIDIMDGKFVDNKNNNLDVIPILREIYKSPIIAHLMVINPFEYIEKIIKDIDFFLFHFEIEGNKDKIIEEVRKNNKKVGFAINPETEITKIVPYLKKIDLILIMSVNPGSSGQKFILSIIKKVNKLSEYKRKHNFIIDVDGGINLRNAKLLKNADILTSSSTILKAEDPNKVIKILKESDEHD
ncbi:MAG: ribulose-phosphate 3-epimerase [Promethearchaeota archaeon]